MLISWASRVNSARPPYWRSVAGVSSVLVNRERPMTPGER